MKINKLSTALIAFTLTVTMGTTTFAAEITEQNGTESTDIMATYNATIPEPDTIYSVDITWGNLEFTYSTNDVKTWDAQKHIFVVTPGTPAWTCAEGANKITVTNHSNTGIAAKLEYAEKNSSGVSGAFDNSKIKLGAPEVNSAPEAAPSLSAQLTLNGAIPESSNKAEIGMVTVTLNEDFEGKVLGSLMLGADYFDAQYYSDVYGTEIQGVYVSTITNYSGSPKSPKLKIIINGVTYAIDGSNNLNTSDSWSSTTFLTGGTYTLTFDLNNMKYTSKKVG